MDRQRLRNEIGCCPVENNGFSDNLAIVLCSYFEHHLDRPANDPHTEHGWGEWAERKANEALDELANVVLRLASHTSEGK